MTSPGKRFQTRSGRKRGGREKLPKGSKGWKLELVNEARLLWPVALASGIDFLISLTV